jgi:hypothetical protein
MTPTVRIPAITVVPDDESLTPTMSPAPARFVAAKIEPSKTMSPIKRACRNGGEIDAVNLSVASGLSLN